MPLIDHRWFTALAAACLLAGCGGGGSDDAGGPFLSADSAPGYAADALTMPVNAINAADLAIDALDSARVADSSAAGAREQRLAVTPAAVGHSAACAGGGAVSWTVTGPSAELEANGRLDAGETYALTYTACSSGDLALRLDGTLDVAVTAASESASDLTLHATALRATTAQGVFTLDGTLRREQSTASGRNGVIESTRMLSGSGLRLASVIGSRQADYTLDDIAWTVVRSFDGSGTLQSRTHDGSLDVIANTPRRADATLHLETTGALTLAPDGLPASGSFVVRTSGFTLTGVYVGAAINLSFDGGNDGVVDRTWTYTRPAFAGEAG